VAAPSSSNEIRLTRVYDAPVSAVWDAWTIPEQVAKWWGPRGFTLTTHSKDLRAGGHWRYTMHGPDGVDYPNVTTYHVVEPHRTLVYDHGASDDRPPLFHVTVTFSEANGQTTMELIFTLPSPEAATEIARHIRQAGGNATWDRLAEHLEEVTTGRRRFVINRTLDAPIARVFALWADPQQLAKWLPPTGTTMRFLRSDIEVGKTTLFVISGDQGAGPGSGHQPGRWLVGDVVAMPVLERGDQRILRQLLGQAHIAHHAGQRADDPGGLDVPDGIDRRVQLTCHPSRDYLRRASMSARRRSSCSRSSGVKAAPKSSASKTGRISTSQSSAWGFGQRRAHSMASSIERTCQSQNPATSSLVSAKGPSMTLRWLAQ
jgi:uncharacterized protein YndB with AHSA1/START domain